MSSSIEYRKITFPKIDWEKKDEEEDSKNVELSPELEEALKSQFDEISGGKKINPHEIQYGLRYIDFHKLHPNIYKVIEDLCLDFDINGKELTSEEIVNYISKKLGENKTRTGINSIFESICEPKENEITPKNLHEIVQNVGENLNVDDVAYVMKGIHSPKEKINFQSDEFYYIMCKTPSEFANIVKKK
jgi:Ca2+-binding EF-hand superfamily protein